MIDLDSLPKVELPIINDSEAGQYFQKWSFVNIYSLITLRDVYITVSRDELKSVRSVASRLNEYYVNLDMEELKPLTERQVLENLNALVKFGLLNQDYTEASNYFMGSELSSELSKSDRSIFEQVFFEYFRFKELSSWLINPSIEFHSSFYSLRKEDFIESSSPIYFYSDNSRFTNSFIRDLREPQVKYILRNDIVMRFWDVYLNWGVTLEILEKFKVLREFNLFGKREIWAAYFVRKFEPFDLIEFLETNFGTRNIWIPELIIKLAHKYRFSVGAIKDYIIQNIMSNNKLTFERTSEIFLIKGKTSKRKVRDATYLYPLINEYYISNLIYRK